MIQTPKIIELPKFLDERGNLSFFENDKQIPFEIARVLDNNGVKDRVVIEWLEDDMLTRFNSRF